MKQIIAIACGGAAGALLRFWFSNAVYAWLGRGFPYGTLAVNISGSFMMGFLSIILVERLNISAEWRAALLVGFLGALTTFSTFSIESFNLITSGQMIKSLINILVSVVSCIIAVWFGMILGRQL